MNVDVQTRRAMIHWVGGISIDAALSAMGCPNSGTVRRTNAALMG